MTKQKKKIKLSRTSSMHYVKLVFRSILFLSALGQYIYARIYGGPGLYDSASSIPGLLHFIWVVFMIEMILRMFPAGIESMGCQKVFAKNFKPIGKRPSPAFHKGAVVSAIAWFILNGIIGVLYWSNIIDEGILFLISLAYSVCDMICILFFCPFQTWFMQNRCCTTCRIYNWDFAMMFTPMVFTKKFFTWSLLAVALIVLVQWEVTVYRHPERFSEETNDSLACKNCTEKLCHHKTQLRSLWKHIKEVNIRNKNNLKNK